jgi:hypothetical protein
MAEGGTCESAEAGERSQTGETWVAAHFLQHSGAPCKLEHAPLVSLEWGQVLEEDDDSDFQDEGAYKVLEEDDDSDFQDEKDDIEDEGREGGNPHLKDEDVRGRVVVLDSSRDPVFWDFTGDDKLARALPVLERHGVVGMIVIGVDYIEDDGPRFKRTITISEPWIPIMLVPTAAAGALAAPNATMMAFPGV